MTFAGILNHHTRPVVTVELSPPKGTDMGFMLQRVLDLKPWVDAINVPDCQRSILKMSSLAAAKLIQDETGVDTVWQLTCRDRNLLALQADLMGAYALGLRNVLALTGDPVQVGDHKDLAQQVFHLESIRLLELIQALNRGDDATGKALKKSGTQFTVGAALNPLRLNKHAQQLRLAQKLERGVQFFQTQPVYDVNTVLAMNEQLETVCDRLGCAVPPVLIGIIPLKNPEMARMMNQSIAGIDVPESVIARLEGATDPLQESFAFCQELVAALAPYSAGFHFMPVGLETKIAGLLEQCFASKNVTKNLLN
ncbi:MAG: methylenetetrahydrofolate reductase [Cyanobacteria bacterium]|nr:methylenetetrahydrofolate reductase [Cyanobacteriota bacterium]